MAYVVNKTNGDALVTVLDGQTRTDVSSITLIGKQITGYGELQNENFLHMLENFSNSIDPIHPLEGQLWWNSDTNAMQVFDGTNWRPISGFTRSASIPTAPAAGDQWWDSDNEQFKVYSGTQWLVIGPAYSKNDSKSGPQVEILYDNSIGAKHAVIAEYNGGNITAIISSDAEFTPNVAATGFTTIKPGISFSSLASGVKYHGTATNADNLDNLDSTQFLRSDISDSTSGTLSVNGQLNVGENNEFNVSINGYGQAVITNEANNQGLMFKANIGGILHTPLTITPTGAVEIAADPLADYEVATKHYVDGNVATIFSLINSLNGGLGNIVNEVGQVEGSVENTFNLVNANIVVLQNNIDAANVVIAHIDSIKANNDSPVFTGTPQSVTPAAGDSSSNIATTAFVSTSISGVDITKIYNGTTYVKANSANVELVVSGTTIATVGTSDVSLVSTPSANDNSTKVSTTAYVDRAVKSFVKDSVRYQGTCYISSAEPSNAVGADGDIWFKYS